MNIFAYFVGVRKLIVTFIFLGIALWLRIEDLINGAEFMDGAKSVLVAYMGTNVGEWFTKGMTEVLKVKYKEIKEE